MFYVVLLVAVAVVGYAAWLMWSAADEPQTQVRSDRARTNEARRRLAAAMRSGDPSTGRG